MINIMATYVFNQITDKPSLGPTSIQVYVYGTNTPLPLLGVFQAHIAHQETDTHAKIYVTTKGSVMLLSCHTVEDLQLITFALSVHMNTLDTLLEEFFQALHGIGCLKDKSVSLHIDGSVQPVALQHH